MIGTCAAWAWTTSKVARPWLSGSERSSRTASTSWPASCSRPLASRPAWSRRNRAAWASARASRTSRTSSGSSSIRRTVLGGSFISLLRAPGQLDDGEPEVLDRADHGDELIELDRLGDIAVGVQVVGAEDVLLGLRGRQDHDRDAAEGRLRLDLLQHLAAVLLREVQVQQDQVGPGGVGVAARLPQEGEGLDAVAGHAHVI